MIIFPFESSNWISKEAHSYAQVSYGAGYYLELMNKINSFDYAGKFKKYKKKIILGAMFFFILLIAYNIFFVTSPISDGKKAAEQYITYENSLLQDNIKAYEDFLNNYDSYKFSFILNN